MLRIDSPECHCQIALQTGKTTMPKIKHKLLRQELAETIMADLRKGVWQTKLPGLRLLAARYGVSKRTCAEALKFVEREGFLEPSAARSKRVIKEARVSSAVKSECGQLLIITELREKCNNTHIRLLTRAGRFWTERGGTVRHVEADYTRSRSPTKLIKDWFEGETVDCVCLIAGPRSWVSALDQVGVPVFLYGGSKTDTKNCSIAGYGLTGALDSILAFLTSRGHRRILLPWHRAYDGIGMCIDAFTKGVPGVSKKQAAAMVPSVDLLSPEHYNRFWSRVLVTAEPSCVLVHNSLEAISLVSFCAGKGIRIPKDLSVFVIDGSELMEWFAPPLAHLSFENDTEIKVFERWVKGGFPAGIGYDTGFKLVQGASVAKLEG
jgi:DNA-binding LacI/PurR family transcriptional regulator